MKLKSELVRLNSKQRLYQLPIPILGLTGGIATGKSTVANLFKQKVIPVISADALVKSIYALTESQDFVTDNFSEAINGANIDFQALRKIAFSSEKSKSLIEDFIYQRLPKAFMNAYKEFKNPSLLIYDVPLLFEKKLEPLVDLSICVYAPREVQIERLLQRDSIEYELAEKIISSQLDIEKKKDSASFCINNSGSPKELKDNFSIFTEKVFQTS